MKRARKFSFGYIVLLVVCILVFALICGLVLKFTKGMTTDFQPFYVAVNGQEFIGSGKDVAVNTDEQARVDVKYVFGTFDKELSGYEVEIKPIGDFAFTADGKEQKFNTLDLKNAFTVDKHEDYFTFQPKGALNDIIRSDDNFATANVVLPAGVDMTNIFLLTVYSYNRESKVEIKFGLNVLPSKIELTPGRVVF